MNYDSRLLRASISADMAVIDELYRQAQRCYSNAANRLIVDMKAMHRANELACKAIDTQVQIALIDAGYHRIDRGPWRKARTCARQPAIPNTQHQVPCRAERSEDAAVGIPKLEGCITACRKHIIEIKNRYESAPIYATSKTAARIYSRYLNRAINRLAAAEKSLATILSIAEREGSG